KRYEVITPRDPAARGCQLSILAHDEPKALFKSLQEQHVIGDFREPNVIRVAPTPLYNSFEDVRRFVGVLRGESVRLPAEPWGGRLLRIASWSLDTSGVTVSTRSMRE
ncbi:MAG: hypothetical protein KDA33_17130, partial [Phycisphaerales bacterium]|nr:hypothetical protein [Phycisphaerales bacterium]